MLRSTTPPVFELRLKTFKTRQRERKRGETEKDGVVKKKKKKFNDNKKKTLSCQKSMSLYFQKGIGNWPGEWGRRGLETRRDRVDGSA